MNKSVSFIFVAAFALGVVLPIRAAAQDAGAGNRASAVFVMSNSAEKNEVIAFTRTAEGTLEESGHFATGGRGSGGNTDPLESQGSLTLSQDHQLLFAVNAGSGEVSVFRVLGAMLALVDRVSSGGSEPNAIAQHGGLIYVLNTGGSSGVTGFILNGNQLRQIQIPRGFFQRTPRERLRLRSALMGDSWR